ncbi:GGDEF domain-containing protein [Vibrio metschnikovii]|nr:GGDEF domain-containing protein [Vibrio metschnikovii]ELF5341827.1 GGDEF domain-containing protein [Vibrio metschnikovii]
MSKVLSDTVNLEPKMTCVTGQTSEPVINHQAYRHAEHTMQALIKENQQLLAKIAKLEYQLNHDGLTGLNTREYGMLILEQWLQSQSTSPLAIVFIDLDNLKMINDQFGHAIGDKALAHIGRILKEIRHDDHDIARFGGDEFVALLPGYDDMKAQRWCAALEQKLSRSPFTRVDNTACHVTVSAGVYIHQNTPKRDVSHNPTAHSLIELADQSMYQVKKFKKRHQSVTDESGYSVINE